MDKQRVLKLWGQLGEAVTAIGSVPIRRSVDMSKLGIPRKVMVAAYREKDREKFEGSLEEFLCWLSFTYISVLSEASDRSIMDFLEEKHENYLHDARNCIRLWMIRMWHLDGTEEEFMRWARLYWRISRLD